MDGSVFTQEGMRKIVQRSEKWVVKELICFAGLFQKIILIKQFLHIALVKKSSLISFEPRNIDVDALLD